MTTSTFGLPPARLSIDLLEGRGIWISLHGTLAAGALEPIEMRLEQLARLGFVTMIVDLSKVAKIDPAFVALLVTTAGVLSSDDAIMIIIDPDDACLASGTHPRVRIVREAPVGAWWQPCDATR